MTIKGLVDRLLRWSADEIALQKHPGLEHLGPELGGRIAATMEGSKVYYSPYYWKRLKHLNKLIRLADFIPPCTKPEIWKKEGFNICFGCDDVHGAISVSDGSQYHRLEWDSQTKKVLSRHMYAALEELRQRAINDLRLLGNRVDENDRSE